MTWAAFILVSQLIPAQVDAAARDGYAQLLAANVKAGKVDYSGIADAKATLDAYLDAVATAKLPRGKNAKIGFYIDAYNALVIRSVLAHGQPKSVLDVKDFFKAKSHRVAGKTVSLDGLEKKILNPLANDPRTHMVLVCAAKGCPILEPKPYYGSNISKRLERATVRYVRSRAGARVNAGELGLSKIFDWYAADFGGKEQAVQFVTKRLSDEDRAKLGDSPAVSFIEYDWRLNKR